MSPRRAVRETRDAAGPRSRYPVPLEFVIRPAQPSDASALGALAFRSKASWGYAEVFMEACRAELTYSPEQIAAEHGQIAVAVSAGDLVGFYALRRTSPSEVELEALFVEPALIGRGVGRALLEDATRAGHQWGAKKMIIQGDPHADRFYRAAGGIQIGTRPSESIEGRHLPVYRIDLKDPETA